MDYNERVKRNSSILKLVVAVVFGIVIISTLLQPKKIPQAAQEYFRQVSFNTIGGRYADSAWDMTAAVDGGYAVVGDTRSFGDGGTDIYLVKVDDKGIMQWSKTFGGGKDDHGMSVITNDKGNYVIAGLTNSFGEPGSDMYFMEVGQNGEKIWENTVGDNIFNAAYTIKETAGGYIAAGYMSQEEHTLASLVKLDSKGNVIWKKSFGGDGWNIFYSVLSLKNSGYLACGYSTLTNEAKSSVYVVKTDRQGKLLWERTYGGKRENRAYAAVETDDGGFLIGGKTTSFISKGIGWDIYLIKIAASGEKQWERFITAADLDVGKPLIKDGAGFAVVGTKKCYGICDANVVFAKVDASGNTSDFRVFSGIRDDYANTILKSKDGGYVICGSTLSGGNGMSDMMIMKIGPDGEKIW